MNDEFSLPVHGATQVDVRGTRDGIDGIAGVEFDYLLVGQLESCGTVLGRFEYGRWFSRLTQNERVCWEYGEPGVKFLEPAGQSCYTAKVHPSHSTLT